jgi:predicted transcriptional regulator
VIFIAPHGDYSELSLVTLDDIPKIEYGAINAVIAAAKRSRGEIYAALG